VSRLPTLAKSVSYAVYFSVSVSTVFASSPWSIGTLSADEQLYVELINRARANPAAEGKRLVELKKTNDEVARAYDYFGVDLAMMQREMRRLAPTPPLVPNPKLRSAALRQSRDMLKTGSQEHVGTDGSTIASRATAAGYPFTTLGENLYNSSEDTEHGHASFEVEWGGSGPGNMQEGRSHRVNIHNPRFREIGVGVLWTKDSKRSPRLLPRPGSPVSKTRLAVFPGHDYVEPETGARGPQVVTQLLGARGDTRPFVTGVAYVDCDNNGFYSLGEGIAGVKASVAGNAYHAISTTSGGFAMPLPGDGAYRVTFSKAGFGSVKKKFSVAGQRNVKVDFSIECAPKISGAVKAAAHQRAIFSASKVPDATRYRLRAAMTRRAASLTAGEDPFRIRGSWDIYNGEPYDDEMELAPVYVPSAKGKLVFLSRLVPEEWATWWPQLEKPLVATVEVYFKGRWTEIHRLNNKSKGKATGMQRIELNLGRFAGEEIKIRFRHGQASEVRSYWSPSSTADKEGWFFNNIELPGVTELLPDKIVAIETAPRFPVKFDQSGMWWVRAEAEFKGRFRYPGPGRAIRVSGAKPTAK
jgi:hypothetical protein